MSSTPTHRAAKPWRCLPGELSQAELCALAGEAVLVQSVSGLHSGVNPVSGDFSTGAEGLRITGGEPAEPLKEFTIASTIQRLLLNIAEVGCDLQWLPHERGRSVVADRWTLRFRETDLRVRQAAGRAGQVANQTG